MTPEVADGKLWEILFSRAQEALDEAEEAREALGRGWLAGGAKLADGIRRKTARLESSIPDATPSESAVDGEPYCTCTASFTRTPNVHAQTCQLTVWAKQEPK